MTRSLALLVTFAMLFMPGRPQAGEALVAVASNFAEAAQMLANNYVAASGDEISLAIGSTGKLYAQIVHGAPFDVLLAADQARPARLEAEGFGVAGSRFTYAQGRLVLWSIDTQRIAGDARAILETGDFDRLAIANPELAPYGLAARQALQHFGLWRSLAPKIVMGEDIGQAFSMVATGNAALGLLAKSQAMNPRLGQSGSFAEIPAAAHEPIRQDAILLVKGANNDAARGFLDYLRKDAAGVVIGSFGYGVD